MAKTWKLGYFREPCYTQSFKELSDYYKTLLRGILWHFDRNGQKSCEKLQKNAFNLKLWISKQVIQYFWTLLYWTLEWLQLSRISIHIALRIKVVILQFLCQFYNFLWPFLIALFAAFFSVFYLAVLSFLKLKKFSHNSKPTFTWKPLPLLNN